MENPPKDKKKKATKTPKLELVVVDSEPRIDSRYMAFRLGIDHVSFMRLVSKYKDDVSEFGQVRFKIGLGDRIQGGGNPFKYALLNEPQSVFVLTLSRNSPEVIKLKKELTREFFRMKQVLSDLASQQQNAEWLEKRESGKLIRRLETDTIQRFVAYAVDQGSQNAARYYANITVMQNKALFFVEQKFKNIRDLLDLNQLSIVVCADRIVVKALEDGMSQKLPYKDIYQLAKHRIEMFAEVHGKTLIPALATTNNDILPLTSNHEQ